MRQLKCVLILIAAAFFLVANGFANVIELIDPPCVVGTAASYVALGAGGCTIGPLTFFNFTYTSNATGGNAVPPGPGGLPSTQAQITPLIDANGVGFLFKPLVPWSTDTGAKEDVDLQYLAKSTDGTNIIQDVYLEVTGSAGSGSRVRVLETYCPGGTSLPPASPCPGFFGPTPQIEADITSGTNVTAFARATFPFTNAFAADKDIEISSFVNSIDGGPASITAVKDQLSIPEPGTVFLLGVGLAWIFVRSRRRLLQ